MEIENRKPRTSLLEIALSAELLDERYLTSKAPSIRRFFYSMLPIHTAQIIEALFIHHRFDVILTQSERVGLPLAFAMNLLGMRTPHILIISRITSSSKKKAKQKMWFMKQVKNSVSRFLIWSSVQRTIAIEELGVDPERITLIKRGTDQRFLKPITVPTDMICSVGMEERDYPTMVEALRTLTIPCHIAAGLKRGELFGSIKRLYEIESLPENITVGLKTYEELRDLYARSRFVVIPLVQTDSDNGLTSLLEAMAMGKAVICSRVKGQVDVIQEGITGIYVPQGNAEALRSAIVALWNDPDRCERMGKAARQYIENHHSLEQFVDSITLAVNEVVQEAYYIPVPSK